MKHSATLYAALLSLSVAPGAVLAEKGPPADRGHGASQRGDALPQLRVPSARQVRQWAIEDQLTGRKPLPPGIRKNLARGKPLPPGIARKMAPQPLLNRLPRYDGHDWQVVGTDLVLLNVATQVVVDVLMGVLE
jgi:Ni/Co efflux regulator RcnB|tara:strand:- start:19853 stop:20254 length:402 start_codon:yes stop_codon:yes gene_type:complete